MARAVPMSMCDVCVLEEDDRGIPRSLRLFAARVEAEACLHASAVSCRSAGSELVRAFRGSATPAVPIRDFLERVHLVVRRSGRSGDSTTPHMVRIDGTCFVLAALYLHRFLQSPAAREAGILVEPATAHRLAAVALFLGTKFGGHAPKKWTVVFEVASGCAIRAAEMADLEERFLRAISFRLFVAYREFDWFARVLVQSCGLWVEDGHGWSREGGVQRPFRFPLCLQLPHTPSSSYLTHWERTGTNNLK
ncbi:hypothetical protein BS78_08G077700 [Paspalum vaginatum]|nr:hypothetical protein BS78_08G077700 [Paspalum vaginatum]KAJ1265450.1 hypothetical protein BS78_08G077700 [Paspalum vaginatum]